MWGFCPSDYNIQGLMQWEIMTDEATLNRFKNEHQEWTQPQGPPSCEEENGKMGFWRLPPLPHNRLVHLNVRASLTQDIQLLTQGDGWTLRKTDGLPHHSDRSNLGMTTAK